MRLQYKVLGAAAVFLTFLCTAVLYPVLPGVLDTHWGATGEVNGRMGKFWGAFILPIILLGVYFLFQLIPKLDPLGYNILGFEEQYLQFQFVLYSFMFLVQAHILAWNLGYKMSPNMVVPFGVGALFYFIGHILPQTRRNWFFGFRTPWTLSSDIVWEKTNSLAGRVFKVLGVIVLFSVFAPTYMVYFVLAPTIFCAIALLAYSFVEFRRQKN